MERLRLHDVRDAVAFATSVADRSGLSLTAEDREELIAFLVETAWSASKSFDPGRGSFSSFLHVRLRQRTIDWQRQRFGRRTWKFRDYVYERPHVDVLSLDGPGDRLGELESARGGDPPAGRDPDLARLQREGSRARARDLELLGLRPARRARW